MSNAQNKYKAAVNEGSTFLWYFMEIEKQRAADEEKLREALASTQKALENNTAVMSKLLERLMNDE